MLTYGGSFPVSALNVGLALALPSLAAQIGTITAETTSTTLTLAEQTAMKLGLPPNVPALALSLAAVADPVALALAVSPGTVTLTAFEANLEIAANLAAIKAQIAIVEPLVAQLSAGMNARVASWTYGGRADDVGAAMGSATRSGFSGSAPSAEVSGSILLTESPGSWEALAAGVATGPPPDPSGGRTRYLGARSGASTNTGAAETLADASAFLDLLQGQASSLEAKLAATIGIGLPEIDALAAATAGVVAGADIDELVDVMISGQVDVSATLGALNADIQALLDASTALETQLSAGGLSWWGYSGRVDAIGEALGAELLDGIPGGSGAGAPTHGLIIVGAADQMTAFGNVFKV